MKTSASTLTTVLAIGFGALPLTQAFWPAVGDRLEPSSPWAFAGCAPQDSVAAPVKNNGTKVSDGMSPELCTETCKAEGSVVAGLGSGLECFCNQTLPIGTGACPEFPTTPCAGDAATGCATGGSLLLWNDVGPAPAKRQPLQYRATVDDDVCDDDDTPPVPGGPPTPGKTTANNGKALYYGCYTEAMRTLEGEQWNSETLTVDACAAFCAKDNWALFGVEFGGECFCGDRFKAPVSKAAEASCNMPCKGKSSDICGGSGVISIWNNTAHIPRRNPPTVKAGKLTYSYSGCYTDAPAARALDKASQGDEKMTVEKCGAFCAGKGFKFMGVEYGTECFCNSNGPTNGSKKVADVECSRPCAGDNTQYCGAPDRINVYKAA